MLCWSHSESSEKVDEKSETSLFALEHHALNITRSNITRSNTTYSFKDSFKRLDSSETVISPCANSRASRILKYDS